ncbi:MAG: hypothetical protein AAF602_05970 [Myxococcota bacterium]
MSRDPLDGRLADLPRSVEPPSNLWPGIASAINEAPEPRWRRWAPAMVLAATALLVASVLSVRAPTPEPPPSWAHQMRDASAALEIAVHQRDDLSPEVVAEIERNLAVIDAAIADCEAALSDHPEDPRVRDALARAWHTRLHVLTNARDLHPFP